MISLKNEGTGEIFYATRLSAGFDICANEEVEILPGKWALVGTGLRIVETVNATQVSLGKDLAPVSVLPELQIRPRSGLAFKQGVTVLNTPATIDADYRGEIKVTLINHSEQPFWVKRGDRIAQGICALVFQAPQIAIKDVERGAGGFGSTGV